MSFAVDIKGNCAETLSVYSFLLIITSVYRCNNRQSVSVSFCPGPVLVVPFRCPTEIMSGSGDLPGGCFLQLKLSCLVFGRFFIGAGSASYFQIEEILMQQHTEIF